MKSPRSADELYRCFEGIPVDPSREDIAVWKNPFLTHFSCTCIARYRKDSWHREKFHLRRQKLHRSAANHQVIEMLGIGNCSGADVDKFGKFGLTAVAGTRVDAPLTEECNANFECRLYDASQVSKHSLFIWEVVKAHVATSPKCPETVHYRGEGAFMISGRNIGRRSHFKAQNL
jgi:hypothetical protein